MNPDGVMVSSISSMGDTLQVRIHGAMKSRNILDRHVCVLDSVLVLGHQHRESAIDTVLELHGHLKKNGKRFLLCHTLVFEFYRTNVVVFALTSTQ
jgi:hypothetical protein